MHDGTLELRNRKFVDSLLEGDGFELPVREHRAMAPSHGFAVPPFVEEERSESGRADYRAMSR